MIKISQTEVVGWEAAIRGMRNPMNSWEKSDSGWSFDDVTDGDILICSGFAGHQKLKIGPNDQKLMLSLAKAGSVEAKYRRMIIVYCDILAPLYWWKEFDTYKVGTVSNSTSTMHKIHAKEFTIEDFSCEHLGGRLANSMYFLEATIAQLNHWRNTYLRTKNKADWWQMIQLLPSSYNQLRTVMLNYEVLSNIYTSRCNHKLDEWREFCKWIEGLPYSEIITLRSEKE